MNVLHVLASNDRRGAEVFATDLARQLEGHGWASTVVAVAASTSTATVDARPLGTGLDRHVLLELRALAREHDVVVAHGSVSLPACAVACLGTSPFIYRSIGDPAYWSASGLRRLQTGVLLSRARTIVALWAGAAASLEHRGIGPERLAVIPNAVPAGAHPPVENDERAAARAGLGVAADVPVVLYLGAFSPEKCPGRAVRLGVDRPDVRVLLVGDGPLRNEVERQAASTGNVTVEGASGDPRRYLAASDVLVIPSDTEGIPAVAIEAGLSGLPVVATDVGGMTSVIEHGVTGFLVRPGDSAALAARVDDALAARETLGTAARARCLERFDMEIVTEQWAEVIRSAAGPRTGT